MSQDNRCLNTQPRRSRQMRIAALQCNFEGGEKQTLKIPRLWADFGFDTEQLFHTHGELYSAVFNAERHGKLLKKYLAESKKNGIKTILYLNCHILLDSQAANAAQWASVNKDGSYIKLYDTYHGCCLHSSWVDYFMGVIDSLRPYDLHGVFFDGPGSRSCFCERCQKVFYAKYKLEMPEAPEAVIKDFALLSRLNFLRQAYAGVKAVNPAWLAYCNLGLLHSGASADEMRSLLACNDIIGTEGGFQFYGPPSNTNVWRCGLHARLVEATAGNKPRVIFMAGDHKPWSWYLHTPAETKLCYASTIANGAGVWYGIHSATGLLASKTGTAVKEMVQFEKQNASYYANTVSAAEIAICHSFDTAKNYTSSGEATDLYDSSGNLTKRTKGDYQAGLNGAAGALFRSGLPFDLVTELNDPDPARYHTFVLPNLACMSASFAERLKNFVFAGGTLLVDGETSLYDENLQQRDNFCLNELFSADFKGYRFYKTHDYFVLEQELDVFAADGVSFLPAPVTALNIEAPAENVKGRLCPPLAGRYAGAPLPPEYPFLTLTRYGKGRVYYIAGMFFEFYNQFAMAHYTHLIKHILTQSAPPIAELLNSSNAVEITVRKVMGKEGLLIHLINYTNGVTRPISRIPPLTGLKLRLRHKPQSVFSLAKQMPLPMDEEGSIVLPPLNEFEVLWVDF